MPGLLIGLLGFAVFLFLVVRPSDVGINPSQERSYRPLNNRVANVEASSSSSEVDDADITIGEHVSGGVSSKGRVKRAWFRRC